MNNNKVINILAATFITLVTTILFLFVNDDHGQKMSGLLKENGLRPLQLQPQDEKLVYIGRLLYFDKALSGQDNVSCATCHDPRLASGDGRALPAGVGGSGLGHDRIGGAIIPRNAPEIFARGVLDADGNYPWKTAFWDGRVEELPNGDIMTPVGVNPLPLPDVQFMQGAFPPTSHEEMLGHATTSEEAWQFLSQKIYAIPEYRDMFADAFPNVDTFGFEHIVLAIGSFERAAYTALDSPIDKCLAGDCSEITEEMYIGARVFFNDCAKCHGGDLFTNQKYYNIGIPQLGPGKSRIENGNEVLAPLDLGRWLVTEDDNDLFAFRVPPLRNVAITGPYGHNGAYASLEDVVKHHYDPEYMLENFDYSELMQFVSDLGDIKAANELLLEAGFSRDLPKDGITDADLQALLSFLDGLTSPTAVDEYEQMYLIPDAVPSGLALDGF